MAARSGNESTWEIDPLSVRLGCERGGEAVPGERLLARAIAMELVVSVETMRRWVMRTDIDQDRPHSPTTPERARGAAATPPREPGAPPGAGHPEKAVAFSATEEQRLGRQAASGSSTRTSTHMLSRRRAGCWVSRPVTTPVASTRPRRGRSTTGDRRAVSTPAEDWTPLAG
jgi:hypothetical protein